MASNDEIRSKITEWENYKAQNSDKPKEVEKADEAINALQEALSREER